MLLLDPLIRRSFASFLSSCVCMYVFLNVCVCVFCDVSSRWKPCVYSAPRMCCQCQSYVLSVRYIHIYQIFFGCSPSVSVPPFFHSRCLHSLGIYISQMQNSATDSMRAREQRQKKAQKHRYCVPADRLRKRRERQDNNINIYYFSDKLMSRKVKLGRKEERDRERVHSWMQVEYTRNGAVFRTSPPVHTLCVLWPVLQTPYDWLFDAFCAYMHLSVPIPLPLPFLSLSCLCLTQLSQPPF